MIGVMLVPHGWGAVASNAAKFGEVEFTAAMATMDPELARRSGAQR